MPDKPRWYATADYVPMFVGNHAETTMKNHFQPDRACYHVAVYDTLDGHFIKGVTHQGYSDSSMWNKNSQGECRHHTAGEEPYGAGNSVMERRKTRYIRAFKRWL